MSLLEPGTWRLDEGPEDERLLQMMLDVELAWLRVQQSFGLVEDDAVAAVAEAAKSEHYGVGALARAAEDGGNPVIPMLAALRERVRSRSESAAAALHRGLTSQDVLDTAFMLLARARLSALETSVSTAADAVARLADEHRSTLQVARTLGQPALPATFGLKAAGWLGALDDARVELAGVRARLPAQCGGAAGTLAAIDAMVPGRSLEAASRLADELGLATAGRPWHTDRSVVTRVGDALVRTADCLGKIASDVALLSRPEIGEVAEAATEGRGGSSTLPQKRNPVLSVLVRSVSIEAPHLGAALHSAAALAVDERPDGAWHAEWSSFGTLLRRVPVAAAQLAEVLAGLEVHPEAMRRTVEAAGPALVAERLLRAAAELVPEDPAIAERLRDGLRSGATREEVRTLLRGSIDPARVDDATIDDLLSPAAYVGAAGTLVDAALERHATLTTGGSR